jgi:hypothetical protein
MEKDKFRMTLWIFGDEHVDSIKANNVDSLALKGTALEFTYHRFNIARKKIKENDTVVVALTNFDRRWFFKHYPGAAITDQSPTNNKKENKAISLFRKYLDHKEIHQTYLIDFLYNLHALTEELTLNTIIVPVYDDTKTFLSNKQEQFPLFNFLYVNEEDVAAKLMEMIE